MEPMSVMQNDSNICNGSFQFSPQQNMSKDCLSQTPITHCLNMVSIDAAQASQRRGGYAAEIFDREIHFHRFEDNLTLMEPLITSPCGFLQKHRNWIPGIWRVAQIRVVFLHFVPQRHRAVR